MFMPMTHMPTSHVAIECDRNAVGGFTLVETRELFNEDRDPATPPEPM